MDRIASFSVNHLNLFPGLYVSRRDTKDGVTITTFDMRMTAPNREPVMDMPAIHRCRMSAMFLMHNWVIKIIKTFKKIISCK